VIGGVVSVVATVVKPLCSFGDVFGNGFFVVGVEVSVGSVFADGKDGGAFASVLPSEDDGGVPPVRSLNLDIIFFLFLYCCRGLYNSRAIRQNLDNSYNSVVIRIYNRDREGLLFLRLPRPF
jgi:hypothetical protein